MPTTSDCTRWTGFLEASDFFTLDVADSIGVPAAEANRAAFVARHHEFSGPLEVPGIDEPVAMTREIAARIAGKYLHAVEEAGRIYRHIEAAKGRGNFITEVSMDETDESADAGRTAGHSGGDRRREDSDRRRSLRNSRGRFNKGVDYVGDVAQFEREFESDLAVMALRTSIATDCRRT